jgi:quinol monooxygenase YgiN
MIIIVGSMTIKVEHLAAFLAEVEALEQVTRQEDGCVSYAMALDDAATGLISIAERWRDEPALRTHLATDGVKGFLDRCGHMILSMDGALYDAHNERPVF